MLLQAIIIMISEKFQNFTSQTREVSLKDFRLIPQFIEVSTISQLSNCSSYVLGKIFAKMKRFFYMSVIISHSLLQRHIVLLTVGVFSSNHRVLYTIGISMTKRFQKSVGPSVCPFVTLTKKVHSSFIIDSRKIIRILDEKVWHPLQKNEAIFSKKYFSKILERIFEKFCTCLKCLLLLHYKQQNNNSHIR